MKFRGKNLVNGDLSRLHVSANNPDHLFVGLVRLGLADTHLGLILTHMPFFPLCHVVTGFFLQTILMIWKAAKIDGASLLAFFKIAPLNPAWNRSLHDFLFQPELAGVSVCFYHRQSGVDESSARWFIRFYWR